MVDPNMMLFQFVGDSVTNATNAFVVPAANKLIDSLTPIVMSCVLCYITLMSYAMTFGHIQQPFATFIKTSVKIIVVSAFALNADTYATYVMGTFSGLESGLAQALNTASTTDAPQTIYQTLDASINKGFGMVGTCWEHANEAGWTNFGSMAGWMVTASLIAAGVGVLSLLGGAIVIMAKFSLALMLGIGPLFILCLMFPMFSRFFDAWFSQVLNYILTIVFVAVVLSFAMAIFNAFIGQVNLDGDGTTNPMFVGLQVLFVCFILGWLIKNVGQKAAALAGGMSVGALALRAMVSPVTGAAGGIASFGSNVLNPTSVRRDLQSGMMTSGTRADHLVAGNTVMNPAYRQALRQNLGRNWGPARGGSASEGS